jgi:hypothetical protein
MLVAIAKIHFEEQALAAGTKQSQHADKAIGPVCLVLCLLLVLFLPSGIFTNKYTLSNLLFLDIYACYITFKKKLCPVQEGLSLSMFSVLISDRSKNIYL